MMAKDGDRAALESLTVAMMGKASKIAAEFVKKVPGSDDLFDDYRNEALLGMIDCLKSYDRTKGAFLSYCDYAMRVGVRGYISKYQRMISQPKNVTEKIAKYNKVYNKFRDSGVENPSDDDLMKAMGFSPRVYNNTKKSMLRQNTVSLDQYISEEGKKLMDIVSQGNGFEDLLIRKMQLSELERTLDTLEEKEKLILLSSFGACGYEKKSTKELSSILGVSTTTINNYRNDISQRLKDLLFAS